MIKILFVANKTDIFSGGEISLLELLSRLDTSRFYPIVLCPGEGELAEKARSMDLSVHIVNITTARTADIKRLIRTAQQIRSIIRKYDVDIVHTNGNRAQFYASLAARRTQARLLWHVRESARDLLLYDWFLARSAHKIVCVSMSVKKIRFSRFPWFRPKIDVIFNGVDTRKFARDLRARKAIREELRIGETDIFLGIIGLLVPLKGHLLLFEAVRLVKETHPDIKLLVLGKTVDELYATRLKDMVEKLGIRENVIFSNPRDDINAILSALDIFILPSQREGFSRILLEAMACSLPIIATDVSGNSEAIVERESGLLVPFGEAKQLAKAIEHFITNTENSRLMGEYARKRVEELFSIESHVSRIEELYCEMKRSMPHT
ncbi:MAG: glycosyltransferase [Candidatus Aminicenantaceae bacterium]